MTHSFINPLWTKALLVLLSIAFFTSTLSLAVLPHDILWMPMTTLIVSAVMIILIASVKEEKMLEDIFVFLIKIGILLVGITATVTAFYSMYLSMKIAGLFN